MHTDKICITIY